MTIIILILFVADMTLIDLYSSQASLHQLQHLFL